VTGLRCKERDIGPGAQTGRPGGAGPAGASLGGKIPAGRWFCLDEKSRRLRT